MYGVVVCREGAVGELECSSSPVSRIKGLPVSAGGSKGVVWTGRTLTHFDLSGAIHYSSRLSGIARGGERAESGQVDEWISPLPHLLNQCVIY